MVKLILISLQIIIAINAVLSKNVPAGNGLKYIGSFRSSIQGKSAQLSESNYYISQNWGACNSAQFDCKRLLNSTLLAVETKEEWNYIREMLENYGFATDYWTSGEYAKNEWRWSVNDIVLAPFSPWEKGHPTTNPSAALRVVINFRNRYDASWSTVPYTQLHRYICEIQTTSIAQPCYEINDLVIVLDSSGSIGDENFEKAKQFVERLTSAFTVHKPSRIAFVTFSHFATTHIDLDNTLSPAEISSTILSTEFEAGSTATHLGIESATEQLVSHFRGVPMNIVVLTDGESNLPDLTIDAAKDAIHWGIRTFSVGITPYINQHELMEIAGNNANRVITTDNFDNLIDLLAPLSVKVCMR